MVRGIGKELLPVAQPGGWDEGEFSGRNAPQDLSSKVSRHLYIIQSFQLPYFLRESVVPQDGVAWILVGEAD